MAFLSAYEYYTNNGNAPQDKNWGSYQYVSLKDIVNNFMLMYSGNNSVINNEERYKVLFHAKRAIQELNYDAFKEIKALELNVCDSLRFVLPHDYVNWVRISMYKDGYLLPLTENIQINSAKAYLQGSNCEILFDQNGNILEPQNSTIDKDRLDGALKSIYLNPGNPFHGQEGWCIDGCWYFQYGIGAMQRKPALTALDEVAQYHLFFLSGHEIAGIGDEHIRGLYGFGVVIVGRHLHADLVVLRQQLQQFQAGKVDIVIVPGSDHVKIQSAMFGHRFPLKQ